MKTIAFISCVALSSQAFANSVKIECKATTGMIHTAQLELTIAANSKKVGGTVVLIGQDGTLPANVQGDIVRSSKKTVLHLLLNNDVPRFNIEFAVGAQTGTGVMYLGASNDYPGTAFTCKKT